MEEKTIFEKIIDGEAPCTKVYEDNHVLAFLDITPVHPGHTLVIPKKHSRNLLDIDKESYGHVAEVVRRLARVIKEVTGADGINIHQNIEPAAGQVVFHTHIHIIPRFEGDGLTHWGQVTGYEKISADEIAEQIRAVI